MINLENMKKSYLSYDNIVGDETDIINSLLSTYKSCDCSLEEVFQDVANDNTPLFIFSDGAKNINIDAVNIYVALGIEKGYISLNNYHDLLGVIRGGVYTYVYTFLEANLNSIMFNYALNYIKEEHMKDLNALDITESDLEHQLCRALPFSLHCSFSHIDKLVNCIFSRLKDK